MASNVGSGSRLFLPNNLDDAQATPWNINNTFEAEPRIGLLEQAAPIVDIPLPAIEQNALYQVKISVGVVRQQLSSSGIEDGFLV